MKKRLFLFLAAAYIMCTASLLTAQICSSQIGTNDGYAYEFWTDGGGSACMTLGSGGTYSVQWTNCGNFVARTGLRPGSKDITINYSCNYNPSGNSYLTVYGWTRDPLIEYYIVESWGTWRPPGGTSLGQVTIDGGTYDIYQMTRTNAPSIDGTQTFQQFWSVRTSKKTSGSVNCRAHFDAWASKGMNLGSSFYEVSFAVEGYQSSGNASVTSMTMSTGTNPTPDPTIAPTTPPATATDTPAPTTISTAAPTTVPSETTPPGVTPVPTTPPSTTNPPATGCTCTNLCSSQTAISVPFTKDGSGEFCYTSSSLASYVNSWNMDSVNINGTNCTNTYITSSSITAISGMYYIYYKGSYSWSHLEIK